MWQDSFDIARRPAWWVRAYRVATMKQASPSLPVGGSCSLSAKREAGSQCCIHKAFVTVKINVGRKWQSRQDCVCG
jgi:hypothetical protein